MNDLKWVLKLVSPIFMIFTQHPTNHLDHLK